MLSLKLHLFALGIVLCFSLSASAQDYDVDHYVDRWKTQTEGCGETEDCCVRMLMCLTQLYSEVQEDIGAGRVKTRTTGSLATMEVWMPVQHRILGELRAPYCPAEIRRSAFMAQEYLSSEFDIRDIMGEPIDDRMGFIDVLDFHFSTKPDNFSVPACGPWGADNAVSPDTRTYDILVNRFEASVSQGDLILAELYLGEIDPLTLDAELAARTALAKAAMAQAKGEEPLPYFQKAADVARPGPAFAELVLALVPLRDAALAANDGETALKLIEERAAANTLLEDWAAAADDHTVRGRLLHHLERPTETPVAFAEAIEMVDNIPGGADTANTMLEHLNFYVVSDRFEEACALRKRVISQLAEFKLGGDEALGLALGDLNCDWFKTFTDTTALIDQAVALSDAGDHDAALMLTEQAVSRAMVSGFEDVDRSALLSKVFGTRGWLATRAQALDVARENTALAREQDPNGLWLRLNMGFIDLLDGNAEAGLAAFQDLAEVTNEEGVFWRGVVKMDIQLLTQDGHDGAVFDPLWQLLELDTVPATTP